MINPLKTLDCELQAELRRLHPRTYPEFNQLLPAVAIPTLKVVKRDDCGKRTHGMTGVEGITMMAGGLFLKTGKGARCRAGGDTQQAPSP
jgi:hypothetical protein